MRRKQLIWSVSALSILAGVMYIIELGFNNRFLGMETMKAHINDGQLILMLSLLFLLQLPPLFLWLFAAFYGGIETLFGAAVHFFLIILIVWIFIIGNRDKTLSELDRGSTGHYNRN